MKKLLLCATIATLAMVCAHADYPYVAAVPSTKADLAAIVESGVAHPVDNVTSAGQPDRAAFEVFANSGYVAVVDMRGPNENRGFDEQEAVENLGMQYIAFPIVGEYAISFENAQDLDELLGEFEGPVLLHCASGNRVGALLALRHSQLGASDWEALAYGRDAGLTRLERVVRQRLATK